MPHYNGLGIIINIETLKHIGRYAQVFRRHYAISFQRCRHFWILVSKGWVSLNHEGTLTVGAIDALDCYFFLLQQILCICFEFTFICFHLSSSISVILCGHPGLLSVPTRVGLYCISYFSAAVTKYCDRK